MSEAKLYGGLTPKQACGVRGLLSEHEYDPHEVLFREGDPSTHLFELRQGLVKLTTIGVDCREQTISLAVPGRLPGPETIQNKTYCFTAETLSPVKVCKLRHRDMLEVLAQNPAVSMQVIDMLNRRAGLIDTPRGRVRILNLARLQACANFTGCSIAAFPHRLPAV